jgi:hypothetical protein
MRSNQELCKKCTNLYKYGEIFYCRRPNSHRVIYDCFGNMNPNGPNIPENCIFKLEYLLYYNEMEKNDKKT